MDGDSTHVVSMVDCLMGEWNKGHLVCVQLPYYLKTKHATLQRNVVSVWPVYLLKSDVQGETTQYALVYSMSGINTTAVY